MEFDWIKFPKETKFDTEDKVLEGVEIGTMIQLAVQVVEDEVAESRAESLLEEGFIVIRREGRTEGYRPK